MSEARPCLRCGDFVTAAKAVLPDLALCAACVDAGLEPTERFAFPKVVLRARLKWMLLIFGSMGVGFAAPLLLMGGPFALPTSIVTMLATEIGFIAVFFSRIQHSGIDAWRRHVQQALGLPDEPALPFVLYVARRPRLWNMTVPIDGAFLVETDRGYVLLGEKTRTVLRRELVSRVSVERIVINPPRSAVRVELPDGPRYFAFLEEKTFRANRARALACAERAARLVAAQSPPNAP